MNELENCSRAFPRSQRCTKQSTAKKDSLRIYQYKTKYITENVPCICGVMHCLTYFVENASILREEKNIGESSRNLYTRSREHVSRYQAGKNTSFMAKHQTIANQVTVSTRDCLTRQVREAVLIRRSQVRVLNGKTEWHQPPLYRIQSDIERG